MIDKRYATEQVRRFLSYDKWLFSIENKPILDEMVNAAMVATSEGICFGVIDEWVTRQDKMPTPAALRRLMYEENAKYTERKQSCPHCGGTGFVTIFSLVTYRGQSLAAVRNERLMEIQTHEQAAKFGDEIAAAAQMNPTAAKQAVLSGAAPCTCLPATHHARNDRDAA